MTLESSVAYEIESLRAINVKPVFVFGGLWPAPVHRHRDGAWSDRWGRQRDGAWRAASRGNYRTAAFEFQKIGNQFSLDTQRAVMASLSRRGVACLRAPYAAAAQLALLSGALQQQEAAPAPSFVHAVWGGLELLLFGVERVVIDTNLLRGTASWVDLREVLHSLNMTHDQFVDMCLVAGYGSCRSCPLVIGEDDRFSFERAYDLVMKHGSAQGVAEAYVDNAEMAEMGYSQMIELARETIQHHHVLHSGCRAGPLRPYPQGKQPLHTFGMGPLPKELHLLMTKGIISPASFNNVINQRLSDNPPSTDCLEYVSLLDELMPLRKRMLQMLSLTVQGHSDIRDRFTVINSRWYDPDFAVVLNKSAPEALEEDPRWHTDKAAVDAAGPLTAGFPLRSKQAASGADAADSPFSAVEELLAGALGETLFHAGLLRADGQVPADVRVAAHPEDEEAMLYATVLLRAKALHTKQLSLVNSGGKTVFAERSSAAWAHSVRLVSRVSSLLPLTCKEEVWAGALDRDLSAFCGLAAAAQHALHNLSEICVLRAVLDRGKHLLDSTEALQKLAAGMPFLGEPSSALGVVMSTWLRGATIAELSAQFPQADAVEADLKRAVRFFKELAATVVGGEDDEAKVRFSEAASYLDKRVAADAIAAKWGEEAQATVEPELEA